MKNFFLVFLFFVLTASVYGRSGDSSSNSSIEIAVTGDKHETSSSSVSSAVASYCVNSTAGQGMGGGISIGVQDPICQHFNVANQMLLAHQKMRKWCDIPGDPRCDYELEKRFYEAYNENLLSAERIMRQTSITGQAGVTTMQLAPFFGAIWLLLIL